MTSGDKQHFLRGLFIFVVIAIMTVSFAAAETTESNVVRIPYKGKTLLQALDQNNIEVLAMGRDGYLDVVANRGQLEFLYSLGYDVSVIHTPDMLSTTAALGPTLGQYHTYVEMESVLTDLDTTYLAITDLDTIGTSIEGRNIYMLKISDNALIDENEPEVLIMGNHHARELMSVEIPLRFAVYLLENYGSDATITNLIDNREIYIAPMINPDGHVYVENNNAGHWSTWWRKNRRNNGGGIFGVDLNRNYSYEWGYDNVGSSPTSSSSTYRGTGPFSEPESQAIRDFCAGRNLTMAFSYHSYGELLLTPWGYIADYPNDHDVYMALGDSLASSNGYLVGNTAMGVIYETNGSTDDWGYGETVQKNRFFSFTPEVNSYAQGGFGPDESFIQPTYDLLQPMNMLLLEFSGDPYAVVGPRRTTMLPVSDLGYPHYMLTWNDSELSDPNPAITYTVVEYKHMGTIPQDDANVMVPLWDYDGVTVSGARTYEGSGSYYFGMTDNTSNSMSVVTPYKVDSGTSTFTAQMWYDIETGWDYAYVQVSTDGGLIWSSIPGNITTNFDPNGNNLGNGITGSSGGWTLASFSLSAYLGTDILIRLAYITDASVLEEGIYVDVPGPVPTFASQSIVASGISDTTVAVVASGPGNYGYVVRGIDVDGHLSRWSTVACNDIDSLTVTGIGDTPTISSRMGRNFPNPFNPVTTIPYAVGPTGTEHVSIKIYRVTGEYVATVVDRDIPTGVYQARWEGRNHRGTTVSSGIYLARMVVGGREVDMRKLVLLK